MSVCQITAHELSPVLALMLVDSLGPSQISDVRKLREEAAAFFAENARAYRERYRDDCQPTPVNWNAVLDVLGAHPRLRWQDLPGMGCSPFPLAYNLPPDASEAALAFVARATRVTGGLVR